MFGWLKSLFGSEPEQERIVPPPLPSKVRKAEKLVAKKVSKRAPKKKNVEVLAIEQVSEADAALVEKTVKVTKKKEKATKQPAEAKKDDEIVKTTKSKKSGRPKKVSSQSV